MQFNVYLENKTPAVEKNWKSSEFKKLWEEKEIAALFSFYEGKCRIVLKTPKKADTN